MSTEQSRHDKTVVSEIERATRRTEELGMTDLRDKLAFISGYVGANHPEIGHALLRIYQPVG